VRFSSFRRGWLFVLAPLAGGAVITGVVRKPDAASTTVSAVASQRAPDLSFDAAVQAKQLDRAIAAYQAQHGSGAPSPSQLKALADLVVEDLAASPDPLIASAVCAESSSASCVTRLRELRDGNNVPLTIRAMAATALSKGSGTIDPTIERRVRDLIKTDPVTAATVAHHNGGSARVPLLAEVLASSDAPAQTVAARLLGQADSPEAAAALRAFLKSNPPRSAEWAAHVALANLGDADAIQLVSSKFAFFQGQDLLEAGTALARAGDARGVKALRDLSGGDDDLLRLQAAGALYPFEPLRTLEVLNDGYRNPNPMTRARALEITANLHLAPPDAAISLLADRDEWVRAQAARTAALASNRNGAR
jgi:HEAT repeat protein